MNSSMRPPAWFDWLIGVRWGGGEKKVLKERRGFCRGRGRLFWNRSARSLHASFSSLLSLSLVVFPVFPKLKAHPHHEADACYLGVERGGVRYRRHSSSAEKRTQLKLESWKKNGNENLFDLLFLFFFKPLPPLPRIDFLIVGKDTHAFTQKHTHALTQKRKKEKKETEFDK